ncbi:MAG: diacylglycerol kinase family lipid kinase [Gemmatimonadales bacterium]|nr:diacylglycerol kinase family lipid kinase [Gemmatimonadales bacterium]
MSNYKKALLIVNPVAGQGWGPRLGQRLKRSLAFRDVVGSIEVTQGQDDAKRWAESAAAKDFDLIVVIGGDGTVGEVVAGQTLSDKKIPIAIIPVGTANVVSLALSLPWFPGLATDKILEARTLLFDVGYVPQQDRYFFLMAALGYPARVINDSPRHLKNLFGIFTYLVAGVRNALNLDEFQIRIQDEQGENRFFRGNTILVSNIGKINDLNFKINPHTSAHDGKFDLTVISSRSVWSFLVSLFRIIVSRQNKSSLVHNFQAGKVFIQTDPPVQVQIDGEDLGLTPFEAEIHPHGVLLVVGKRYSENDRKVSPLWAFKRLRKPHS